MFPTKQNENRKQNHEINTKCWIIVFKSSAIVIPKNFYFANFMFARNPFPVFFLWFLQFLNLLPFKKLIKSFLLYLFYVQVFNFGILLSDTELIEFMFLSLFLQWIWATDSWHQITTHHSSHRRSQVRLC